MDNDGAGAGWYIDPVPGNSGEFTDRITRYELAMPSSSSIALADMYRTTAHEIGHALGILTPPAGSNLRIGDFLTPTATPGLLNFQSVTTSVTFTTSGGGHIYSGQLTEFYQSYTPAPNDLMNTGLDLGTSVITRQHISPLNLQILRDAYGYTVNFSALRTANFYTDEIGAYNPGLSPEYRLRNGATSQTWIDYAGNGWTPFTGDWDGDGRDEVGAYNPNATGSEFRLRNRDGSQTFYSFAGGAGWVPLAGDWDGDGRDEIGAFNPNLATNQFRLLNRDFSQTWITFAGAGWTPLVGDWDGDGRDEIGAYNPNVTGSEYRLLNRNGTQTFISFAGALGWVPITGDWDGDGKDNIGAFNPGLSTDQFRLLNGNGTQTWITFAGPGWTPLSGNWEF